MGIGSINLRDAFAMERRAEADSSLASSAGGESSPKPIGWNTPEDSEMGKKTAKVDASSSSDVAPSWFTPKRLLVIFCMINMLNYVDRGVIASNGVNGIRRTCTEAGVCTSGRGIQYAARTFLHMLLTSCLIYYSYSNHWNQFPVHC